VGCHSEFAATSLVLLMTQPVRSATFRRWSRWACSIAKEAREQSAEMVDGGLLSVFLVGSGKLPPHAGVVFGVLQVLGGGEIMSRVRALP